MDGILVPQGAESPPDPSPGGAASAVRMTQPSLQGIEDRVWEALVVGSGIAGLRAALALAEAGPVLVVTKKQVFESNTNYAQGGIASVLAPEDAFDLHVDDTLEAGAGLCHEDVVRRVVEAGPELIRDLVALGIRFSEGAAGAFALGREGGHSQRRIVHAGDFTGRELESALCRAVQAEPNILVLEDHMALELRKDSRTGRVAGAWVLDREANALRALTSRVVLLASGGSGKVYRYTSNPDIATGDGLAMAYRAGATLANLEFFQFHPTCLFHPEAKNFLISEAVRGEGAILRNLDGEAFMERHHARADLAPRDIVARAIDREMKERGEDYVHLDTTVIPAARMEERFPNITARCRQFDLDPTQAPLPVVPAAHYQCGGVAVDAQGASDLPGLHVIGEAACTGLHGANRLASNSLLEALYLAHGAARSIVAELPDLPAPRPDDDPPTTGSRRVTRSSLRHDWEVARRTMWDYVGIFRDGDRLRVAGQRMATLAADADALRRDARPDAEVFELRNVTLLGDLITRCASFRRESRGLHALAGEPGPRDGFRGDTRVARDREPHLAPIRAQSGTEA